MYDRLRTAVDTIKIIDDHGHPCFTEFFENVPAEQRIAFAVDPFKTPEESSAGFPYLRDLHYEAYEKLYGFSKEDIKNPGKREELSTAYEQKRKHMGEFIDEIMELAGVEALLVNFVMPDSLKGKENLKFVPVIDPLFFPFDDTYLKQRVLGKSFVGSYEYILSCLKNKYDFKEKGFEEYLGFIDQVLEDYVKDGCVAFKFALAYARNTYFEKVDLKEGPTLYEKAKSGDNKAYTRLQDLFVWHVMRKAVKYNLPVQFHFAVTDNYVEYFDPLNLANMLADPELMHAKIVILHGGYPRFSSSEVLALGGLSVNNVYIDISGRIMFANHPKIIAKMLRNWLEKPALWGKILYGSDVLWGERYLYTCAKTARDAVYYALDGMIDDDIIDEDTAITIAKNILRENSIKLYHLPS